MADHAIPAQGVVLFKHISHHLTVCDRKVSSRQCSAISGIRGFTKLYIHPLDEAQSLLLIDKLLFGVEDDKAKETILTFMDVNKGYKEKLETAQRRMEAAKAKMEKEKDAAQTATQEVTDLLSWADTFDEANAETKHMIIARLVERIEINHDYEVEIKFRISVEQYMRIAA